MRSYKTFKKGLLKDPKVRQAYEQLGPEFALIEALIARRIEQRLTQEDLARRIGTRQSAISRLERGEANPTLGFLKKVAAALDASVLVSLS